MILFNAGLSLIGQFQNAYTPASLYSGNRTDVVPVISALSLIHLVNLCILWQGYIQYSTLFSIMAGETFHVISSW